MLREKTNINFGKQSSIHMERSICKAIVMSWCTWYFDTLTLIQQQWSRKRSNKALSYNTKLPQIDDKNYFCGIIFTSENVGYATNECFH